MGLNIKNPEAEEPARQLASETGENLTRAITVAVQERLDRIRRRDTAAGSDRTALLQRISRDAAGRWVEPHRSSDHGDLLYDEAGLPPMIVDTSALIAILRGEPDADRYIQALTSTDEARAPAATYLETAVVVDVNRDPVLSGRFDDLVAAVPITVEPVTRSHADIARRAYRDFGKGSGHPAGLDFGDCFAYALARATGEPLLFTGAGFSATDLTSALDRPDPA